jgi:hypothetical protein
LLASSSGRSLMIARDAIMTGHVGMMAVQRDDDGN